MLGVGSRGVEDSVCGLQRWRETRRKEGRKEGWKAGRHLSLVGREGIGGAQGVLPRCMYKLNTVYIEGKRRRRRRLEARRATWRRWRLPLPSSIMRTMTNRGSKARAASVASERASERVTSCLGLLSLSLSLLGESGERGFSLPVRYVGSAPSLPPHLLTFKR